MVHNQVKGNSRKACCSNTTPIHLRVFSYEHYDTMPVTFTRLLLESDSLLACGKPQMFFLLRLSICNTHIFYSTWLSGKLLMNHNPYVKFASHQTLFGKYFVILCRTRYLSEIHNISKWNTVKLVCEKFTFPECIIETFTLARQFSVKTFPAPLEFAEFAQFEEIYFPPYIIFFSKLVGNRLTSRMRSFATRTASYPWSRDSIHTSRNGFRVPQFVYPCWQRSRDSTQFQ